MKRRHIVAAESDEFYYKKDPVERVLDKAFEWAASSRIGVAVANFFDVGLEMEETRFEAVNTAVREKTGLQLAFRSKASWRGDTYVHGVGLVAPDGTASHEIQEAWTIVEGAIDDGRQSATDMTIYKSTPKLSHV
jgi:hypothetical protein